MARNARNGNLFFPVLVYSVSLFILTIFALVAAVVGESTAPLFVWINDQAGMLILAEVAVIMIACVLALAIDRRQILKQQAAKQDEMVLPTETHPSEDENTDA